MKRSSLGTFPKRYRWTEVVFDSNNSDADLALLRRRLETLLSSTDTLQSMVDIVSTIVGSRDESLRIKVSPRLAATADDHIVNIAENRIWKRLEDHPRFCQSALTSSDPPWRVFDSGSTFTEVARVFFSILIEEQLIALVDEGLHVRHELLRAFAWDLTQITVAFTARWFSKCVRDRNPSANVVRWYLRHCAGKLDMELERELDPSAYLYRKQRAEPSQLHLNI